jgi:HD-like signal output (HDOD) protein
VITDKISVGTYAVNLPSAPAIVTHLSSLIQRPEVSSHEIANIVETDQGFTARLLKLVNSPFYGFARQITSVDEAITMLGLDAVHQLLLTTSLLDTLSCESQVLDMNQFWLHSFAVGATASTLVERLDKEGCNEAFMCGILHDIGRLIFIRVDADRYTKFYDEGDSVTDLKKEAEWFGMDHQQVAEKLAECWNFPPSLTTAIGHHHTPDLSGEYGLLSSAVHVADVLCHALGIGTSGNIYVADFSPSAYRKLELDPSILDQAIVHAVEKIDRTRSFIREI